MRLQINEDTEEWTLLSTLGDSISFDEVFMCFSTLEVSCKHDFRGTQPSPFRRMCG